MELRLGEFLVVKSQRCHWSTLAFVQAQLWIPDPRWEFVALRRNRILVAVLVQLVLSTPRSQTTGALSVVGSCGVPKSRYGGCRT